MKIFIDAITVENRIISIYSNNQISIFNIDLQTGRLQHEKSYKILENSTIKDGKFVMIYNKPYFLTKNIMFHVEY